MREIKLRGWTGTQMIYQDQNTASCMNGLERFTQVMGGVKEKTPEIMQFTGLKDKNGKEIYEGDIVKETNKLWEIYFDNHNAWFWWKSGEEILGQWNAQDDPAYPYWRDCEVVGNVYENKELL